MHSIASRINNGSAFLSSCVMALLAAIALSSFLFTAKPTARFDITGSQLYRQKKYQNKVQDLGLVNFYMDADFTPLFHWNTKQLFLYVEAEYTNAHKVQNTVVIWDKIIRSKEDAHLKGINQNKYAFKELSTTFKGASNMTVALKYNLMPYVGALTYGEAARVENVVFKAST